MALEEYVVIVAVALISATVIVWPSAVICRRAGYSPWLGLIAIVPLAQIALLWLIALSPWAAEGAGPRTARRPEQALFSFFRSLRVRIRTIGLPPQP
jgi:hypothetical protein